VRDLAGWLIATRNDLSDAAVTLDPRAALAVAALTHDGECLIARMSGSGPTAYGLFPTRAAADRAAARLAAAEPSWWVKATMTGAS
jgi:4-diphosphocytidyl-2-C-methyl-D-erythritol kinase